MSWLLAVLLAFSPLHLPSHSRHRLMMEGRCTILHKGDDYFDHPGERSLLMYDPYSHSYGLYGLEWLAMEDFMNKRVVAWCRVEATRPGN